MQFFVHVWIHSCTFFVLFFVLCFSTDFNECHWHRRWYAPIAFIEPLSSLCLYACNGWIEYNWKRYASVFLDNILLMMCGYRRYINPNASLIWILCHENNNFTVFVLDCIRKCVCHARTHTHTVPHRAEMVAYYQIDIIN